MFLPINPLINHLILRLTNHSKYITIYLIPCTSLSAKQKHFSFFKRIVFLKYSIFLVFCKISFFSKAQALIHNFILLFKQRAFSFMASRYYFSLLVFAIVLISSASTLISALELSLSNRLPSDNSSNLYGQLSRPSFCPVNCFRTNPVGGADVMTYWYGCTDAQCAGIPVISSASCHIVWLTVLSFSLDQPFNQRFIVLVFSTASRS